MLANKPSKLRKKIDNCRKRSLIRKHLHRVIDLEPEFLIEWQDHHVGLHEDVHSFGVRTVTVPLKQHASGSGSFVLVIYGEEFDHCEERISR